MWRNSFLLFLSFFFFLPLSFSSFFLHFFVILPFTKREETVAWWSSYTKNSRNKEKEERKAEIISIFYQLQLSVSIRSFSIAPHIRNLVAQSITDIEYKLRWADRGQGPQRSTDIHSNGMCEWDIISGIALSSLFLGLLTWQEWHLCIRFVTKFKSFGR